MHNADCFRVLSATEIPAFTVDKAQLGKKLGKHVQDFGGDVTKEADRVRVTNLINEIGSNPEKVITGTFAGQGANGTRGAVHFRIKDNDVVVTKPNGEFVTVLKDSIYNTSVETALKGLN